MSSEGEEIEGPSSSNASSRRAGKLFLGGVGYETTEPMLQQHFSQYGELAEVAILRDRSTGRPRGFGFVTFKDPTAAEEAVKDTHVVDGREIDVKKSVPQETKGRARKIFVGGLSPDTTEDAFKEYFGQFGQVAEVQIMVDHMSGRSRGFGFVTFEEDGAAERVFQTGIMHDVGGKRVEVKPATPKGTGPQSSTVRSSSRTGRASGEFAGQAMMSFPGQAASYSPYMPPYGGYTARPGVPYPPPPYNMQYPGVPPQYMMPYGMPGSPYAAGPGPSYGNYPPPQAFTLSPPGQAGATPPLGFGRPAVQQRNHITPVSGGGMPGAPRPFGSAGSSEVGGGVDFSTSPTPSPPLLDSGRSIGRGQGQGGGGGGGGKPTVTRNKVDSASSLDQAVEQRLNKLSLE